MHERAAERQAKAADQLRRRLINGDRMARVDAVDFGVDAHKALLRCGEIPIGQYFVGAGQPTEGKDHCVFYKSYSGVFAFTKEGVTHIDAEEFRVAADDVQALFVSVEGRVSIQVGFSMVV